MAKDSEMQENILDKLLSKSKSEEMYELRRLQHQQRPVSEFDSKQKLEEFFCKRLPPPQLDAQEAAADAASISNRAKQLESTASKPKDFMPEGIRLEVRGLFDQRRVTETLEGPLREEIDQTLREGLERRQIRGRNRRSRANGSRHHNTTELTARQARQGRRHVRFNPPENGEYPIPQRDQTQIVDNLLQSPALNSLNPEAREEIVSEVRSLVQQQLVTSALSGEFRGVLELNIQQQLNHSQQGLSGEDFIRSLRRGSRRSTARNSEPSAARPPRSMGDGDLHSEMREMKSQLDELKKLVQTSFELQLDIQRSIRQEVAAALSVFLTSSDSAASCTLPTLSVPSGHVSVVQTTPSSVPVVECGNCVICSDGAIDSIVYRCGHMCMCMACGMDLKSKGMKCPVCRAPITDVIRAYSSML